MPRVAPCPCAPLLLALPGPGGCNNAPSLVLPVTTGTTLTATAIPLGPVKHVYQGSDAAGDSVTWDLDAAGNVSLSFAVTLSPTGAPAYQVSGTFLWTGLTGNGVYFLPVQSLGFADAGNPALEDRDDCGGQLTLPGDGTFSLSLTVTGMRYPSGAAPAQTTSQTVLINGTETSGNG